ncbi:SCP2 sterol-binding domain-containing protein [Pseudomonas sp. R2.Fl]|nr:SCP2 sterol-binding domain-containing protein [Pseudomonas sp. R2.Fl]
MQIPPILAIPLDLIPLSVIERASRLMLARIAAAHPDLFERLGEHKAKRFAFVPTDLPLTFLVEPSKATISVYRKPATVEADATTEAPLFLLLALMEGRFDADALFFSRHLSVTGDMEAMLAMRNALDDSDIDLQHDLALLAGPLAPLAGRVIAEIRGRALRGETASWS